MNSTHQTSARVACPACQADVDVTLTYSITPGTPDFQRLFEGKVNQGVCPSCGTVFAVSIPLVFRDDDSGLLIYQMPLDDHSAWPEVEQQVRTMADEIFAGMDADTRPDCRVTFHRRNFIEKIAAFAAGFDDRLLEYIKYQLYSREDDPVDHIRYELLLDFSRDDEENLVFLLFNRETGDASAAAYIPMSTYDSLEDAFQGDSGLAEELDTLFPGVYVSVERLYD
ncbi:MAG: CpXC domain-containing protein [Lentisphaeria bacterium]|nr:CpXC domain-containing protein [Lentisphaeria bacterium]